MSRVRNATDFRIELGRLRKRYDRFVGPQIQQVNSKYADRDTQSLPENIEMAIEWHLRSFLINAFLAALNWRMNLRPEEGLPDLIPEAPLRSADRGTIRYLDYLGLESETCEPLLIVETKRPKSPLPELVAESREKPPTTVAETLSMALKGGTLKGEWDGWLRTAVDYIRSTADHARRPPRRFVMTDGSWFIIVRDPCEAFLADEARMPDLALVLKSWDEVMRRSNEVFLALEQSRVLGRATPLRPEEILFYTRPERVRGLMHGLRLLYIDKPRLHASNVPEIRVAPVVFVQTDTGSCLDVEALNADYVMPLREDELPEHLRLVGKRAEALAKSVKDAFGLDVLMTSLSYHYASPDGFSALPGVRQIRQSGESREFLLVTGEESHYVMSKPTVDSCPFHDYQSCVRRGVHGPEGPVLEPSVHLPCYFVSGCAHHCAHIGVVSAKRQQVTRLNRDRCGQRSAKDGEAFCEISAFERYLCCRACVFEPVCIKSQVFRLPCS